MSAVQDDSAGASQAALAIAQLRASRLASRRRFWSHTSFLDEQSILGLDLDDVLLGADALPPLKTGETRYRRWLREQKEAREEAARSRVAAAEETARWLRDQEHRTREAEQRATEAEVARRARRAQQKAQDLDERERLVATRWTSQAIERAGFEALFSDDLVKDARQRGIDFDLCTLCGRPFWTQYDNIVNWDRYWKGPPRCQACFAPPLTARARRENPTWTPMRIAHEVVMAIYGLGEYAGAVELMQSRAWWTEHDHDYQQWINRNFA